jgi:hypothetical protein
MNKIKLKTNSHGQLSSTSRDQLRTHLRSHGGIIGEKLAAIAIPQLEREIRRRMAAQKPVSMKPGNPSMLGPAAGLSVPSPGMVMVPVKSSSLRRVGYIRHNRTLRIEFKEGSVWDYLQVPPSEHEGLMKANSHGKYFQVHIKRNCLSRKVSS